MEDTENFIYELVTWARDVKGITSIELDDLLDMIPEYEQYKILNNSKCKNCGLPHDNIMRNCLECGESL